MIKLIETRGLGAEFQPPSFIGEFDIYQANILLLVWHEDTEGAAKFIYSPSSNVKFMTGRKEQTLTITLYSETSSKVPGTPRFTILGHSAKKKMKGAKDLFKTVEYRKRGTTDYTPVTEPHRFPMSADQIDSVRYTLQLDQHEDDTYINLIVQDLDTGSIIDCDPQVENGTKT